MRANPIYEIAVRELKLKGEYEKECPLRFHNTADGKDITKEGYQRLSEYLECNERVWEKLYRPSKDYSVAEAMEKCGWKPETPLDKAVQWYEMEMDYGTLPDNCSYKWNMIKETTYMDYGESLYHINDPRGFDEIARYLKGKIPDSSVKLN